MRFGPAVADADVRDQGDLERIDLLHLLAHDGHHPLDLSLGGLEDQFVVDLQQHLGLELRARQLPGNGEHRQLADVGRRTLDRGVRGDALARLAVLPVVARQLRNVAAPAEQGGDEAVDVGLGHGRVEPLADAAVVLEVAVDVGLGLFARDAEDLAEGGRALTVDGREVDELADLSLDDFLDKSQLLSELLAERLEKAQREDKILRYVARLEKNGSATVGVEALSKEHALANLLPCDNIFAIESKWYKDNPLVIRGPGAGREVTAGAIQSDLNRLAGLF